MKRMRISWVLVVILFMISSALVVYCWIYVNRANRINKLEQAVIDEVVVDNKISMKAKEIHDYIRENNYGYCTYDYRCNHEGECGLNSTFEDSKNGKHNTCCATYVSWVLQETGYITKKQHNDYNFNAANNLSKFLSQNGWRTLEKDESLKPGDILVYNHHVAIYGGRGAQYDAGNKEVLTVSAPCRLQGRYNAFNAEKVLRAPDMDALDIQY